MSTLLIVELDDTPPNDQAFKDRVVFDREVDAKAHVEEHMARGVIAFWRDGDHYRTLGVFAPEDVEAL